MTTLIKRRNPNRLLTPWNDNRLLPWSNRSLRNLLNFDVDFNDDFFEEDSLMPALNVKEHKNDFAIEFAAPGFSKKDFEVSIEENVLHVEGEKSTKEIEEDEDYMCKEFSYNSFKRSLVLPESVDLNQKIKANYKDGILIFNLIKKEEAVIEKSKTIIEIV